MRSNRNALVAVSTKPHQEKQAELHISQCGIECFPPLLKESKVIRRTRKTVIEPHYPGYLFAQFELERHDRAMSYAARVGKVVEFGSRRVELDPAMIDAIKERLNDGYLTLMPVRPAHGQVVHIKGGPLAGLEAVFIREMPKKNRIVLFLTALGFQARFIMDSQDVSLS